MPRVSVLTAASEATPEHRAACVASIDAQTMADWGHVLIGDDGDDGEALAASLGDIVVFVDPADVLVPHALERIVDVFDAATSDSPIDVVYSDHDIVRAGDYFTMPVFKPDFSLERLRNHDYITRLVGVRREAIIAAGGLRDGVDGAPGHDLLLRLSESGRPFAHVPEILVHQHATETENAAENETETATETATENADAAAGCGVVAAHLERCGISATVDAGVAPGVFRIRRHIVGRPLVSVIIPTRGSRARVWGVERVLVHEAVASILDDTSTCDIEIIAVIDRGTDPLIDRGLHRIVGDALRVVDYEPPFNFSAKVNQGADAAAGDFLLILNDDTQLLLPGSIDEMVALAQDPSVGMVGAKLIFDDGRLQHGGHVYNEVVAHALLGWPGDKPGPDQVLAVERECAGVTAAAALVPREVHREVGGMDLGYDVNFNDVDYSLRIRATGRRILWTPHACWYHFEHGSDPRSVTPAEVARLEGQWGPSISSDPYYNPNLTPDRCDWLERPMASVAKI